MIVFLICRYDISDDGQIDQKELSNMIAAMVKFWFYSRNERIFVSCFQYDLTGETDRKGDKDPKKKAADIIGKLDVGGDRKLSKQEFIAGYVLFYYAFLFTFNIFLSLDARMTRLFVKCLLLMFKIAAAVTTLY